MSLDPYEALANAVVLQAVKDWRESTKKVSRGRRNINAQDMKEECLHRVISALLQKWTEICFL